MLQLTLERRRQVAAALAALALANCWTEQLSIPEGGAPVEPTCDIEAQDGEEVTDCSLHLQVVEAPPDGPQDPADFSAAGRKGDRGWHVRARLALDQLAPGVEIVAPVEPGLLEIGQANVYVIEDEEPGRYATGGEVRLTLGEERRAEGSVSVEPSSMSATFSGELTFSCYRRHEGSKEPVLDTELTSPFCEQFQRWR